jgi:1-acyl-sn-glycerol-3-phosphate acyltransferase
MANHISDIDVVAIQLACPRRVYFMAKEELFDIPFIGWFIGWLGAFPVKRGAPDRKAIKKAVELLKKGCAVALFPEGGLSQTGELQPLLPGAALIAQLGEVPVICCGVKNTNRILPYGKLIPRPAFSWITVRWGKMESFDKNASREEIIEWAESQLRDLTV